MFSQVLVQPGDTDLQRFLWFPNGNLNRPVERFSMTRHVFGATSSPFVAAYALQETANQTQEALAKKAIKSDFYVDDLLTSCDNAQQAVNLSEILISTLDQNGFELTKFISNDEHVMSSLPNERLAPSVQNVDINLDLTIERTLGLQWIVSEDSYTFHVNLTDKPSTRRGVLSTASSLYDPLGFVAPVTLLQKLILQSFDGKWDDPLDCSNEKKWHK